MGAKQPTYRGLGTRLGVGQLRPMGQVQPSTCFCTSSPWAKNNFYIFKWLKKSKEGQYFMRWKWYETQFSVSINKTTFLLLYYCRKEQPEPYRSSNNALYKNYLFKFSSQLCGIYFIVPISLMSKVTKFISDQVGSYTHSNVPSRTSQFPLG